MPGGSCGNLTAALAPKFPRSTKPAPLFCDLSRRTAQHRSFPAPWSVYSHPLQNRVPRVQVLLPLPKKSGIAFAVPDFFVSERKDLAARCARRPACGACRGGLQPGGLRPGLTEAAAETSPMSIYACFPIRSPLFSTVLIPSSTRNAPDFGCFRLKSGAFRSFCPLLTYKISSSVFVHPAV